MVQKVGEECRRRGLFFIPQHDGWLGLVEEGKQVAWIAIQTVKSVIGFAPTIKAKRLTINGQESFINHHSYTSNTINSVSLMNTSIHSLFNNYNLSSSSSFPSYVKDKGRVLSPLKAVSAIGRSLSPEKLIREQYGGDG
jgi:hypothetical protein